MASGIEQQICKAVSKEVPWDLVTAFSKIVRESGTVGEWRAAQYIYDNLKDWGANVTMLTPELLISVPRGARLEVLSPMGLGSIRAKTPAFSTTNPGVEAETVFIPSPKVQKIEDMFSTRGQGADQDINGKIVISEGMAMPMRVRDYERRGAAAQIYVHPGEAIHEGICTSIWGTPTLTSLDNKPKSPVVCINASDGAKLIELTKAGTVRVRVETKLDEGWVKCPLNTVWIEGYEDPEKFVMVHGHLDSWHEGIGDNATGDAALLELARVFTEHRGKLRRSLRVCWWPGHSQGRYAGSTWFADEFARDLTRNCIAQINIDSPGCRNATEYMEDVMWMRETDTFCRDVIRDVTGQESRGKRPLRAGDYSFNQVGLTGFFMLLSNIPPARRKELGYNYVVGGCGGNTAWHTEIDTLEVGDPDVLATDIKIYTAAITRLLNADIFPFEHSHAAAEILDQLEKYQATCQGHLDLSPAIQAASALKSALETFERASRTAPPERRREINQAILDLARILVPLNYARGERFDHDPAVSLPIVPKLDRAPQLPELAPHHQLYRCLQTELIRERNKIVDQLDAARLLAERFQ
jgi:N-acetylated-alpha-linked acidic dipeptidase